MFDFGRDSDQKAHRLRTLNHPSELASKARLTVRARNVSFAALGPKQALELAKVRSGHDVLDTVVAIVTSYNANALDGSNHTVRNT